MTAKGAALSWAEEDNNFLLLLNFVNLIGAAFNADGTMQRVTSRADSSGTR